jgi:nitronate monooxygenase
MALRTALTDLLGIRHPILLAPMGGVSGGKLATAVSRAGGLGLIGAGYDDGAWIEREFAAADGAAIGIGFITWHLARHPDRLRVALARRPVAVMLSFGDPAPFVPSIRDAGARLILQVQTLADARAAAALGADVVVAQGAEAGGHGARRATLPLVPAVVDAIAPTPVAAAGGIADGRGLAAVLALGAGAAWMGTRFLLAEEAATHPIYREAVIAADETATAYSSLFDVGWPDAPLRTLRNSTWEAWRAAGEPPSGARPGEGEIVATGEDGRDIARYDNDAPVAGASGDVGAMCLYAGQGVGLAQRIQPAAEIVREVAEDAARVLAETRAMEGHG